MKLNEGRDPGRDKNTRKGPEPAVRVAVSNERQADAHRDNEKLHYREQLWSSSYFNRTTWLGRRQKNALYMGFGLYYRDSRGFPGGAQVKNPPADAGDTEMRIQSLV